MSVCVYIFDIGNMYLHGLFLYAYRSVAFVMMNAVWRPNKKPKAKCLVYTMQPNVYGGIVRHGLNELRCMAMGNPSSILYIYDL